MSQTKNNLAPYSFNNSFNNLKNCTFYLRKENFKPTIEWANHKIKLSLKTIGNRYITYNNEEFKDLNINVKIYNYFNSITSIDEFIFYDFYSSLKNNDYEDAIAYIEFGLGVKLSFKRNKESHQYYVKNKDSIFKNTDKDELEYTASVYYNFSKDIEILLSFYEYYADLINQFLSKDLIKINIFHKETIYKVKNIDNIYAKIQNMNYIDRYMGPGNGSYIVEKIYKIKRRAKWIYDKNIIDLKKFIIEKEFEKANIINPNNILSTYLFKHILLDGEAMSGKTHLLSDIAKIRINSHKPTILIYAQKFDEKTYDTPIQHSIKQLGLDKYQLTDEEFLELLNNWGKKLNELVFFIIDAINETKNKNIWHNYFIEFTSLVKEYPYISLTMSIRDVEKKTIFTKDIQRFIPLNMMEVKHKGFEKIEYSVLKKFCKVFDINLPTFPFTSSIFSNPGLLFLFFETLKRKGIIKINENILKPNFIINEYIKDRNNNFKELNNILDRRTFITRATNKISSKIVTNGFIEDVKYDNIFNEMEQIHKEILDYLISEGILLENINDLEEILLYFSYQRFGNYFIALYLLPDAFSNINILNKEILYSLFLNYEVHQAVIEALIIRLSENHGLDFIDIFPELFKDNNLNNIRYKCFSQALILPITIQNKLKNLASLTSDEQYDELELLLKMAYEKNNNLNIKSILHPLLLSLNLNLRDGFWSIYIHHSFINNDIVNIIITWALNKEEDFILADDSLYLYGLTLGWFLTSSNRELRDTTTKALVNLFTNNIDAFLEVIKEFESADDLYVLERLYAVAYGIVLRSNKSDSFIKFGKYIYNTIFNQDEIVEHILLRDYAKLTVEYINNIFELNIDMVKVLPPYGSKLLVSYPTDKDIDTKYDKYSNGIGIGSILSSMITISGRSGNYSYGDFGRYTFQS